MEKELANGKAVTYKIKFINVSFLVSSPSSLADKLAEGLHRN